MNYKKTIGILVLIVITIIGYTYFPKTIYQIIGISNIDKFNATSMKVAHKNSILDEGEYFHNTNKEFIEMFISDMKSYKFHVKLFSNYKDLDNKEFHSFTISNSKGEQIKFTIFDDKTILMRNALGYYGLYEIAGTPMVLEKNYEIIKYEDR